MPEVSLRGGAEHQATAIAICFLAKGLIRFCTFFEKKYQKMWENRFEMVPPRPLQTRQGERCSPLDTPCQQGCCSPLLDNPELKMGKYALF